MNALENYINHASLIIKKIKESKKNYFDLGIDNDFIQKFEEALTELKKMDEEQETLKVKYKVKTSQVDDKIDDLNKYISKAKNVINETDKK